VDQQDGTVCAIAMIEDPEALDEIDAIVATEDIDGVFIGRGDLTVAFGAPGADSPVIQSVVHGICTAAKTARKPVCVMVGNAAEAEHFVQLGASDFIVASDQSFMSHAASRALEGFAGMRAGTAG
jgi:2-keto-3-deoxy-L-rhamnonate aldolase RhmA